MPKPNRVIRPMNKLLEMQWEKLPNPPDQYWLDEADSFEQSAREEEDTYARFERTGQKKY